MIVLLLSLLIGGNVALSPLVSLGDHTRSYFSFEEDVDSDDADESLESKLAAALAADLVRPDVTLQHSVSDEVNHQIDWLFLHKHAARAPPLG